MILDQADSTSVLPWANRYGNHGRFTLADDVPGFMNERLMTADSLGRFFNAEIKGHYPEAKL